jgi:uncharacterized repeat protein (TIGR03803 family)
MFMKKPSWKLSRIRCCLLLAPVLPVAVPILLFSLSSMLTIQVHAQDFSTLYSFTGGTDGAAPTGLILSGDTLYGTAAYGGTSSNGTIYAIKIDGTGFKTLHSFANVSEDGAQPQAPLVQSGTALFGTATAGGNHGYGTIFKVNTDGTGFTVLHHFAGVSNGEGAYPYAGLSISSNALYGTTFDSPYGDGTVFTINGDGSGFLILHHFDGNDGALPQASLLVSGNTLFGTALSLFKVNTDGGGFQILHGFSLNDGIGLHAGLLLSGNRLFGTAATGGSAPANSGTVFAVNTDGTDFAVLHNFTSMITNFDGAGPEAELILSGNKLFGSSRFGGWGYGAIFKVNTDGTGYETIYNFSQGFVDSPQGGAQPAQNMVLSGNTFYSTTLSGGISGNGTVFSLSVPITPLQPAISTHGEKIILAWPTNIIGLKLQVTTNLLAPVWTTVSSAAIVNGQNTITNSIPSRQQFYRLSQ